MQIGVDYGTTTTLAVSWTGAGVTEEGRISSSVFVCKNRSILTKESEYRSKESTDGRFIHSPKTLLGQMREEDKELVSSCIRETLTALFSQIDGGDEDVWITLTVPVAWKDTQYVLMRDCVCEAAERTFGRRFHRDRLSIIPEPVAAALYFIVQKEMSGYEDVNYAVVCDVGGGTSDLAVVKCGKYKEREGYDLVLDVVCPMAGERNLGGDLFDSLLKDELFPDGFPAGVPQHLLWNTIRIIKTQLSTREVITMPANRFVEEKTYSRKRFEELIAQPLETLSQRLLELRQKLQDYDPNCRPELVYLLPVGGSCRIPLIQTCLQEAFQGATLIEMKTEREESFDSIARGASFYAAWRSGRVKGFRNIEIGHRIPNKISIKYADNALATLVEKNAPDGEYSCVFRPISLCEDGQHFRIGKILFYQGDGNCVSGENILYGQITLDQLFDTGGKRAEEIPIVVRAHVNASEITAISLLIDDTLSIEGLVIEKVAENNNA